MKLTHTPGVALVTGGSGGIGAATVSRLARSGLSVALTYRNNRESAERLVGELDGPVMVRAYPWDDPGAAAATELIQTVGDEVGPVRYLVASAGVGQTTAFFKLEEDDWRTIIDTNLTGVIAVVRAAVTSMMKAGFGRIVTLGSVSGSRGLKGHTIYAATKAALEGFTRPLAQEAAAFGVTVNCVAPGFIDTPMLGDVTRKRWTSRIPMRRLGTADEVAGLITYLCSDEAAYVTGQGFTIDGGISL